jgi:dolichyl-phosphate-mannose--protein O-mannosyl transferase
MENLKNRINEYFDGETETLLGSLLIYGFTGDEITQAEKAGFIKVLEEGVVYKMEILTAPYLKKDLIVYSDFSEVRQTLSYRAADENNEYLIGIEIEEEDYNAPLNVDFTTIINFAFNIELEDLKPIKHNFKYRDEAKVFLINHVLKTNGITVK